MHQNPVPKDAFALLGGWVKLGLKIMHDTLDKLQLTLIELEYAVAEVLHQIDTMSRLRADDLQMLRQHARILDISVNNIVQFAYLSLQYGDDENIEHH